MDTFQFIAAIMVALPLILGAIANLILSIRAQGKLDSVASKVDAGVAKVEHNTKLTEDGNKEIQHVKKEALTAVSHANETASLAVETSKTNADAMDKISKSLNGGFEERITACVSKAFTVYMDRLLALERHDKKNSDQIAINIQTLLRLGVSIEELIKRFDRNDSATLLANEGRRQHEENAAKIERLKIHDVRNIAQLELNKAQIEALQKDAADVKKDPV